MLTSLVVVAGNLDVFRPRDVAASIRQLVLWKIHLVGCLGVEPRKVRIALTERLHDCKCSA
jgi:hypothetical protein